ncbi:MAG: hypothetical protein Q7S99_05325 [Parvibaculum sp.]|nr:hypothetical protein [Parvibaculum sp.]
MNWAKHASILGDKCQRTFAEVIAYTPKGGARIPNKRGIFEPAFEMIDAGGDVGVNTVKPVFWFRKADLTSWGIAKPVKGDVIEARGLTYEVVQVEPDGYEEFRFVCYEVD